MLWPYTYELAKHVVEKRWEGLDITIKSCECELGHFVLSNIEYRILFIIFIISKQTK